MTAHTNEELVRELVDEGYLKTPAIIDAMKAIDRKDFVPEEYVSEAYGNYPLPIAGGQTISQPLTVAFMLELLEPKQGEKILDVGAGSGWQTAMLAHIVGENGKVVAIERIEDLFMFAGKNVAKYHFLENGIVKLIHGDGAKGYEAEAPYNKIIAAAAAVRIPEAWKEQVKVGGRIVAPVGESIVVIEKTAPDKFNEKRHFGFSFVPLVSEK